MKSIFLFITFIAICIIPTKSLAQSKNGAYKTYFQNGKVKSEETYKNGKKIGTCKYYAENGKLLYEENFNDNGLKEGIINAFYENGQLESSYTYRNGEMHGVFKEFYENGKLRDEGKYEYGQRKYYPSNAEMTVSETKNNTIDSNNTNEEEKPFETVEEIPQFEGGGTALMKFISNNLKYPIIAYETGVQGKVLVRFIIDKNGNVTNPQVTKSLDPACDKEALRIVRMMPQWIAGKQNGRSVPVYFTLPILFRLKQ